MYTWNNSKKLCGLQIMDTHVRMIELIEEGKQLQAGRRYTMELPPCSVINGIIKEEAAVVSCIETMVKTLEMQAAQVHLIIPTSHRITRKSIPIALETREFKQLMEKDSLNVNYNPQVKHAIHNYVRLGSPLQLSQQEDVLTIATSAETIQGYLEVVKKAGLELLTIEPTLFSLYRAIFRNWQDSNKGMSQRFVLVQSDLGFSEISVFDRGVPVFTFVINGADYASIKAYTYDLQMEFKRILSYFRQAVFSDPKDLRDLYLVGEMDWLKKLLQPVSMMFEGNMTLLSLVDLMNTCEMVSDPYAAELGLTERGA
ncbi:type IV pilus biogenesis protein PilM [Paenibacillus psychroresistens]|nr:pilus assembly protein PilM [Paenibacillus psychroresistens]